MMQMFVNCEALISIVPGFLMATIYVYMFQQIMEICTMKFQGQSCTFCII